VTRTLRDYQAEAIDAVYHGDPDQDAAGSWEDKQRRAIVLPTGTGKGDVGAAIAVREARAGNSVLNLAHRSVLLDQIAARTQLWGPEIAHGRVEGGTHRDGFPIVEGMTPTLARVARRERIRRTRCGPGRDHPFDVIIYDECHHAAARGNLAILRDFGCFEPGHTRLLGMTATFTRGDRYGLKDAFVDVPFRRSIGWAIDGGWLVEPYGRVVVTSHMNLRDAKVSKVSGDYDVDELGDMVVQDTDQIVKAWQTHAFDAAHPYGRLTAAFTPDIASAEALAAEFVGAGVPAACITQNTRARDRDRINREFSAGNIRVLVNVMVLTEGWDVPEVDCVLMARPTKLPGLYAQVVGRGLRLAPGKVDCLVLDVVGVSRGQQLATLVHLVPTAPYDTSELDAAPCDICGLPVRGADLTCTCPRDGASRDPDGGRTRLVGPVEYELVDLVLRETKAAWLATLSGQVFLPNNNGRYGVLWENRDGTWRAGHVSKYLRPNDGQRLVNGVDLAAATAAVERWARQTGPGYSATRSSTWRKREPSPQLCGQARGEGIDHPQTYKAGELSDLIAVTRMTRRLDRKQTTAA
jgi:superfamily II DNA or RNA helicase